MKTFIIEETVSITYFHKVLAENKEEAEEKFYNDVDMEYNIKEPFYGDDATLEFIEKRR